MYNDPQNNLLQTRQYGSPRRPAVIVLHGGPGAAGYMAPVARRLGEHFNVIEPFQRKGTSDEPVTLARHVADLHAVIQAYCGGSRPILVGHSWGAMLALVYAAEHNHVSSIVLIGSGTFDAVSRQRMDAIRQEKMKQHVYQRMQARIVSAADPDERLKLRGKMMMQVDSYRLMHVEDEIVYYDALGHEQTWRDMMRFLDAEVYPEAFRTIDVPVLMLHGREDPHPGTMIRDSLKPVLPQLEYHEWSRCGHYPWLEKGVSEDFYSVLVEWLLKTSRPIE